MNTRSFALAAALLMLAACSSTPSTNLMLEQARASFESAQNDPQVVARAPDELNRARVALREAEEAWAEREALEHVEHLSYLAIQRSVIAEQAAAASVADEIVSNAAEQRERLRLQARTAEAEAARQQLAATQQSAARSEAQRQAAAAEAAATQRRLQEAQRREEQIATAAVAATASATAAEARARDSEERLRTLESQLRELNAQQTPRGMVVTLGDVLFETGEATLLPGVTNNLNELAEFFERNPEQRAIIEGHTDNVGTASSNYQLSQRRADAVRDELLRLGVPAANLTTRALGPDNPVASNGTPTGRQMNRRVEIVFPEQVASTQQ